MKKSSSMKWLLNVIGKQKFNIIFLTVIQTVLGISSVIFAFILRNIVDSAASRNKLNFFLFFFLLVFLILVQILFRAIVRCFDEKFLSSFEMALKYRLLKMYFRNDYSS